jgi:RhtB (resistance to homoserine/threonine) family protein
LEQTLTIALLTLFAAMSPGPDFAIVTRNAVLHSRAAGIWTAAGIALGMLVHVAYCVIGVGLVLSRSVVLFTLIKFAGALYLIYIGWKGLTKKGPSRIPGERNGDAVCLSSAGALRMGFFTNALNPKATLFILSVFTQVIHPSTPMWEGSGYGLVMAAVAMSWFSFVAIFLSNPILKRRFQNHELLIERTMGALILFFGVSLALATVSR